MRSQSAICLLLACTGVGGLLTACKDNNHEAIDAAVDAPKDAPIDAPAVADRSFDEGGGITIEYQSIFVPGVGAAPPTTNVQARVTAYYWDSLMTSLTNPRAYPFAPNPGCIKTGIATPTDDSDDVFPWGMGEWTGTGSAAVADHTYLDVGTVTVSGGAMPLVVPRGPTGTCVAAGGATCTLSGTTCTNTSNPVAGTCTFANGAFDAEQRKQDGLWNFFVNPTGGATYLGNADATYSLAFGGSGSWPAQTYPDAFYMPPAYVPLSPGMAPSQLIAGTPFVQTWTPPPAPANLPAGASIFYITGFIIPGVGPVAVCLTDNLAGGMLTVPADIVDYVRSIGAKGVMGRAMVTHRIQELTDGVTHNHKRMDFVSKWCIVTPWTAP